MADEVIYRGYNEEIDVNMVPGGPMSVWHSSQYDELRKLRVNLYNGKSLQYLGSSVTVSLSVRKNDGNIIESSSSDVIKIVEENPWGEGSAPWRFIEINTTQQMTACVGKNICEIVVYETVSGETSRVGSANFILEVEKDPLAGGIRSDSEIDDLQAMVDEAVGNESLSDLGDVEINEQTLTMNQALMYNARTGTWENAYTALGKLLDVMITNPQDGDVLGYDPTSESWINMQGGGGGGSESLSGLIDVELSSGYLLHPGRVLMLDRLSNTNNKWVDTELTYDMYATASGANTILPAGQSTLTIYDDIFSSDKYSRGWYEIMKIYTSKQGLAPYSKVVDEVNSCITLKFVPQTEDVEVFIRLEMTSPYNYHTPNIPPSNQSSQEGE